MLEVIRKSASYWERNSTIWNRIQGKVEDQQQNLRAMELYLEESTALGEKEKQTMALPLVEFTIKRERLVGQSYDRFNHFPSEK